MKIASEKYVISITKMHKMNKQDQCFILISSSQYVKFYHPVLKYSNLYTINNYFRYNI